MSFCKCEDWLDIVEKKYDVIQYNETHEKWLISWLSLEKNNNHHLIDRYGLIIRYCPFCGNKLK